MKLMKVRKVVVMLALAMPTAVLALGVTAVRVGDVSRDEFDVGNTAQAILKANGGKYAGLEGVPALREVVSKVMSDYTMWMVAAQEVRRRRLDANMSTLPIDKEEFARTSMYRTLGGKKMSEAFTGEVSLALVARADFGQNVRLNDQIKSTIMARYAPNYKIYTMDPKVLIPDDFRINAPRIYDDNYDSIEEELRNKPASKYFKAYIYVHYYSVRYAAIAVHKYVNLALYLSEKSKVFGSKNFTACVFVGSIAVLPIVLFLALIIGHRRSEGLPIRFRHVVVTPIFFYFASVALYIFGLSAKGSLLFLIIIPLLLLWLYKDPYGFIFTWFHMPNRKLYRRRSSCGPQAPEGKAWDEFGYLKTIEDGDLVFDGHKATSEDANDSNYSPGRATYYSDPWSSNERK